MSDPDRHSLTGNRIEYRQEAGRRLVRRHWSSAIRASWLGANREAELAAHLLADQVGIAPRIINVDLASRWMDIEWIDADRVEVDDLVRSSSRSRLWTLLDTLRGLEPTDVPPLDVSRRIEDLLERLRAVDPTACSAWQTRWDDLRASADEYSASQAGACVVHGDLHSGNLLRPADGRLVCIDWEYAHAGHPLEDLAGLLAASSVLQIEWIAAQRSAAPHPDWWPQTAFDALGCPGHVEQVRYLTWWIETRRTLDGVWMALAAHSAGNGLDG